MEVYLTLAARDLPFALAEGREVWLVIKTHSCSLNAPLTYNAGAPGLASERKASEAWPSLACSALCLSVAGVVLWQSTPQPSRHLTFVGRRPAFRVAAFWLSGQIAAPAQLPGDQHRCGFRDGASRLPRKYISKRENRRLKNIEQRKAQ